MIDIISENQKRESKKKAPYDQITGEGCNGDRIRIEIPDLPVPVQYIPKEMEDEPAVKKLIKYGSVYSLLYHEFPTGDDATVLRDDFCLMFTELRAEYDFEFFAQTYPEIMDKVTAMPIPFSLNRGQRRVLATMEKQRKAGLPIRIILLKARQWGGSTLVQMYMLWIQCFHRRNWHSLVCAHLRDAAVRIRDMFDRAIKSMPPVEGETLQLTGFGGTQNIKQIPERGCRVTVGTAQEPDSVRSDDVKMAHFSEAAFYPNTEGNNANTLITSIVGTVPRVPYSMIVIESTANGVGDFFHTEAEKAKKGEGAYEFVFVEWFLFDMYKTAFDGYYYNHSGKRVKGGVEDFAKSLNEYEKNLFWNHQDVTLEAINWYRSKKAEMPSESSMMQEYPSDDIEAFQTSGQNVFRPEDVEAMRKDTCHPEAVGYLVSEVDPASARIERKIKGILRGIKFVHDAEAEQAVTSSDPKLREAKLCNRIKVWKFPDTSLRISNRYAVIYDPSTGVTSSADNGVILVIDRYWMMYGGKPEVVAEWVGHEDKDIAVWRAVQIAIWYNNALFVPETNTFDSEDGTREEQGEFIFDTIASVYTNVYSRTEPDKLKPGIPIRYGWHTNRSTKPMIVADYTAVLREKAYIERESEALDEARYYERKKNGSFGAKEGKRDDRLITRMIGCFVVYRMDLPKNLDEKNIHKTNAMISPVGESSI